MTKARLLKHGLHFHRFLYCGHPEYFTSCFAVCHGTEKCLPPPPRSIQPYDRYGEMLVKLAKSHICHSDSLACQGHFREEGRYGGGRYFLYTEQMDAEGLGRRLLLTPLGTPPNVPEKQTLGTVSASHKMRLPCKHFAKRGFFGRAPKYRTKGCSRY